MPPRCCRRGGRGLPDCTSTSPLPHSNCPSNPTTHHIRIHDSWHLAPRSGSGRGKRGGGDRRSLLPNRLAAARALSWRRWRRGNNCPAAGPFGPWDVLDRRRDHTVAAENRDCGATSALAITLRSNESRPLALAASERAQREVGSGRAGQARAFGRTSERAFRKRATPAERAEASVSCASDSGGASGSGPGRRPGGSARDDLPRRSRQARSRSRPAGVTAPGHGGHGATHGFHGAGHSEHGDGEQPAGPVCAAASAAGAAAFTRAGGRDKIDVQKNAHRSCDVGRLV